MSSHYEARKSALELRNSVTYCSHSMGKTGAVLLASDAAKRMGYVGYYPGIPRVLFAQVPA